MRSGFRTSRSGCAMIAPTPRKSRALSAADKGCARLACLKLWLCVNAPTPGVPSRQAAPD